MSIPNLKIYKILANLLKNLLLLHLLLCFL